MNRKQPLALIVFTVVLLILITGCATQQTKRPSHQITIETIDSQYVEITSASLKSKNGKWLLYGKVARKNPRRGPIPGHLSVEIVNKQNEIVSQTRVSYKRRRVQSTYANFNLIFPFPLSDDMRLRIIHYGVFSHAN